MIAFFSCNCLEYCRKNLEHSSITQNGLYIVQWIPDVKLFGFCNLHSIYILWFSYLIDQLICNSKRCQVIWLLRSFITWSCSSRSGGYDRWCSGATSRATSVQYGRYSGGLVPPHGTGTC